MTDQRLRTVVGTVILVTFSISFAVGLVSPSYNPPASIQGLMVVLVGYVFGGPTISTLRKGNGRHDDADE